MARQVVSYDDLDVPSTIPSQTASPDATFDSVDGSKQRTAESNTDVPFSVTKKRRRDEAGSEVIEPRNMRKNDMREGGGTIAGNADTMPTFQALPPKPQVKKRGRNNKRPGGGAIANIPASPSEPPYKQPAALGGQHWDDPGLQADRIVYDDGVADDYGGGRENGLDGDVEQNAEEFENAETDDESRQLTHEEIWDDSALIAAWDAANEEYEAMHGKDKRWKQALRKNKSPLWYNIPPEKPTKKGRSKAKHDANGELSVAEGVSREASGTRADEIHSSTPLNFESFVPTHDPSLAFPRPPGVPSVPVQAQLRSLTSQYSSTLPGSQLASQLGSGDASTSANLSSFGAGAISTDEAFSRALDAMYACGYWTAVYHIQRVHEQGTVLTANDLETEAAEADEEDETEALVSTQR